MSKYALRIPDSLFEAARQLAVKENTSINQLFVVAIAEKISAIQTEDLLKKRAAMADDEGYENVLGKIPSNEVIEGDEIS